MKVGDLREALEKAQKALDDFKKEKCECGHLREKHFALIDGFDRFWMREYELDVCGKGSCQDCQDVMRVAKKPDTNTVKGCRGFESFDFVVSELRKEDKEGE